MADDALTNERLFRYGNTVSPRGAAAVREAPSTREAILDAAQACLLAFGPSVSVTVIGKRVGISGPAVLKRFGSKENLVTRALLSEAPPDLSQGPKPGPLGRGNFVL